MEMISSFIAKLKRLYLNYNMITSLYIMEPIERTIINCFIILIISLMLYSSWVYLPHYTWKLLVFAGVLQTGAEPTETVGLLRDADTIHRSEF